MDKAILKWWYGTLTPQQKDQVRNDLAKIFGNVATDTVKQKIHGYRAFNFAEWTLAREYFMETWNIDPKPEKVSGNNQEGGEQ